MAKLIFVLAFLFALVPVAVSAQSFDEWREKFVQEAIDNGVSSDVAHGAMDTLLPDDDVLELDQKQPETTITFEVYSERILRHNFIQEGRELYHQNIDVLERIATRTGVSAPMIVALWGIESHYGRNSGNFDIVTALATLAYAGRRAEFFHNELMDALRVLDSEHMDPTMLLGSWAGAMGQCQFMPSTYLRYAVDEDGDGKRDIWNDASDLFASIANYLTAEGWIGGSNWGQEVTVPHAFSDEDIGLKHAHSIDEWRQMGVESVDSNPLASGGVMASLVQPDGPNGRSFLVYDNFRALMRWNRSTYFATTVGLLADRIAR